MYKKKIRFNYLHPKKKNNNKRKNIISNKKSKNKNTLKLYNK